MFTAMPKPGTRREGREAALQFLFSHDLNEIEELGPDSPEVAAFWELRPAKERVRDFAMELIRGIRDHHEAIDERIVACTENYTLARLGTVDRNLLRMTAYELLYCDEIPAPVSINEAIEIAKRFGTEESPKFINGVLDRIRREAESIPSES
jgi:N utilization substance protein B